MCVHSIDSNRLVGYLLWPGLGDNKLCVRCTFAMSIFVLYQVDDASCMMHINVYIFKHADFGIHRRQMRNRTAPFLRHSKRLSTYIYSDFLNINLPEKGSILIMHIVYESEVWLFCSSFAVLLDAEKIGIKRLERGDTPGADGELCHNIHSIEQHECCSVSVYISTEDNE